MPPATAARRPLRAPASPLASAPPALARILSRVIAEDDVNDGGMTLEAAVDGTRPSAAGDNPKPQQRQQQLLPPRASSAMAAAPSPVDRVLVHEELLVAREILEHGALLSIRQMDIPAFERYVAQLKVYYSDASILTPSQRQFPILGLNLLRLLAQNRIAEFHTELELIPTELQHANIYIKYPAQLEQHIMEGSYHKVLSAKTDGVFSQEGM
jgi:hypothetical protein